MSPLYKKINIKSLFISADIEIRPLETSELQTLLLMARNSGFYGNNDLIRFIVSCGALNDSEAIEVEKLDIFLVSIIAREVWLITLKSIEKTVRKLSSFLDYKTRQKVRETKIRRYKFSDLASPGLLWQIQKDMERVDVDRYAKELVNHMIPEVKIKNKIIKGKEKEKFINEEFESACSILYESHSIDADTTHFLSGNQFSSEQRFYISLQLAETLDWHQYLKIIVNFNICVENLTLKSNQLGGVDTSKAVLITGIPLSFELFRYPTSIPLQVLLGLLKDVIDKKNINISRHYNKILRNDYNAAIKSISSNISNSKKMSPEDTALKLLSNYANKLNSNNNLVYRLCYIYFDEFSESMKEHMKTHREDFEKKLIISNIPDCYLLVEGISEEICFKKFIKLLKNDNVFVKIIDCNGKSGVYKKYRDVIKNESYIGSVVTALDSDATEEHNMIKKIDSKNATVEHYIYEKGEFEDLFPIKSHIQIINSLYDSGEKVVTDNFDFNKPITKQLSKIIWQKKKANFDKSLYSEKMANTINIASDIPDS